MQQKIHQDDLELEDSTVEYYLKSERKIIGTRSK